MTRDPKIIEFLYNCVTRKVIEMRVVRRNSPENGALPLAPEGYGLTWGWVDDYDAHELDGYEMTPEQRAVVCEAEREGRKGELWRAVSANRAKDRRLGAPMLNETAFFCSPAWDEADQ